LVWIAEMVVNAQEIIDQLQAHNIDVAGVHDLQFNSTSPKRYREINGKDKEKRAWAWLHTYRLADGTNVGIGAYGIWRGADQGTTPIKLGKDYTVTKAEKKQITARLAADRKRAENERKRKAKIAAIRAEKMWPRLSQDGHADYLTRKRVKAYDIRFTKKNAICLPVRDADGVIHGLQFILDRVNHKDKIAKRDGRDKELWPPNLVKKGHFFMFGGIPAGVILVCEGYATAATLHEATGLPTVVAFDANNLGSVVEVLIAKHPKTGILICADDDDFGRCLACKAPLKISHCTPEGICPACGEPHKRTNAGVNSAMNACLAPRVHWLIPRFLDEAARFAHYAANKGKLTDYNDLHCLDSLNTVRVQIEDAINAKFPWALDSGRGAIQLKGGRGDGFQSPIDSADGLLRRFVFVEDTGGGYFDRDRHSLIPHTQIRQYALDSQKVKQFMESERRQIAKKETLGFDPTDKDKIIKLNLWDGVWPIQPIEKEGGFSLWLELLNHLCSLEDISTEVVDWIIKWLAYPLQNPGAKMRTAIGLHGPQGAGKDEMLKWISALYGKHYRMLTQAALADKHNDILSAVLFAIGNELGVGEGKEGVAFMNRCKSYITEEKIHINPKGLRSRDESNHMNLVFFSNTRFFLYLEADDRRHLIVWTARPINDDFYARLNAQKENGGLEALYHYLLNLPLGDFNENTKPPMTVAKRELIDRGKNSVLLFYDSLVRGELYFSRFAERIIPMKSDTLYRLYRIWCKRRGDDYPKQHKDLTGTLKDLVETKDINGTKVIYPTVVAVKDFRLPSTGLKDKATFIYLPMCKELPTGEPQIKWLGECEAKFSAAVDDYKGISL
jgi:putative DNA primase/helicase